MGGWVLTMKFWGDPFFSYFVSYLVNLRLLRFDLFLFFFSFTTDSERPWTLITAPCPVTGFPFPYPVSVFTGLLNPCLRRTGRYRHRRVGRETRGWTRTATDRVWREDPGPGTVE